MRDRLFALVTEAVRELNETRDDKIPTDDLWNIGLYGETGVFDSMHLVSFLALVEEKIEDEFDLEVSLTSEKAVSQRVSPFSSISRLIDFTEAEIRLVGAETVGS